MSAACEVSVVIPTRNRAGLLTGAIRSALAQENVAFEVLIVDDGSEDETPRAVAGFADDRISFLRNRSSRGVAAARNQAIARARGEWIAFLDDDDLWAPGWLAAALDAGRAAGSIAVYGSRWVIDGRRQVRGMMLTDPPYAARAMLATHNSLGGPSGVLVRTDVLLAVGGFDSRLSALADWDLWLRVLEHGRAAAVAEPLLAYTLYDDNMHLRAPFAVLAEFDRFATIVAERAGSIRSLQLKVFITWLAVEAAAAGRRRTSARLWLAAARRLREPQHVIRAALALLRDRRRRRLPFSSPTWLTELSAPESYLTSRSAASSRYASSSAER